MESLVWLIPFLSVDRSDIFARKYTAYWTKHPVYIYICIYSVQRLVSPEETPRAAEESATTKNGLVEPRSNQDGLALMLSDDTEQNRFAGGPEQ